MATGLATRCSACGTAFRVVPDQLRVSEGWVRCGRCTQVFNALESLVDMDTGMPRPGGSGLEAGARPPEYDIAEPAQRPADERPQGRAAPSPPPVGVKETWDGPAFPREAGAIAAPQQPLPPDKPGPRAKADGPGMDAKPDWATDPSTAAFEVTDAGETTRPVPTNPDLRADPESAPQPLPSFVRSAEHAARWRDPRVRATLALLCLAALLSLAAQVAIEYRDLLAARLPLTRPWLEAACEPLGCKVEAARVIDSLAVDSSGLLRVERSNLYKLQVSLRNRAGIALAVPALDLRLTDSQGRLIARKVLLPADLGVAQATIDAGRDLNLQATLQLVAGGDAGVPVIAGYTIELFYP